MSDDTYLYGTELAFREYGLQKTAFLGAIRALGPRIAASPMGQAIKSKVVAPVSHAISKVTNPVSDALSAGINQGGAAIEAKGVEGARRLFGNSGATAASTVLKGAPSEAIRQGVGGALIGGGFQGTLDAAMAEDGQRGDAFLNGAGMGAASGAAFGVLGGGFGQATKNIRRTNLKQNLTRQGINPATAASKGMVNQQMDRGFFGNLKDVVTKQGPMGRSGSLANLGGQVSQVGTEWIAPMAILPASLGGGIPGMGQPQPAQPEQLEQPIQKMGEEAGAPFMDPVLASSIAGSSIGAAIAGTGADLLAHAGHWPGGAKGIIAKRFSPMLGAVPGALTGRYLARQQWPNIATATPEVEKLKDIDFDKLMRYYQKRSE